MSSPKRNTPAFARALKAWAASDHDPDAVFNPGGLKHGWRRTPTYETWANLKRRHNRGDIILCATWWEFSNFLKDMGAKPDGYSLRRIVVADVYSPVGCLWRPLGERQPGVDHYHFDPDLNHNKDQSYYEWKLRRINYAKR